MRKPVLAPSGNTLTTLIYQAMLAHEAVTIAVRKIPSRLRQIDVDTDEAHTWKNFIEVER